MILFATYHYFFFILECFIWIVLPMNGTRIRIEMWNVINLLFYIFSISLNLQIISKVVKYFLSWRIIWWIVVVVWQKQSYRLSHWDALLFYGFGAIKHVVFAWKCELLWRASTKRVLSLPSSTAPSFLELGIWNSSQITSSVPWLMINLYKPIKGRKKKYKCVIYRKVKKKCKWDKKKIKLNM